MQHSPKESDYARCPAVELLCSSLCGLLCKNVCRPCTNVTAWALILRRRLFCSLWYWQYEREMMCKHHNNRNSNCNQMFSSKTPSFTLFVYPVGQGKLMSWPHLLRQLEVGKSFLMFAQLVIEEVDYCICWRMRFGESPSALPPMSRCRLSCVWLVAGGPNHRPHPEASFTWGNTGAVWSESFWACPFKNLLDYTADETHWKMGPFSCFCWSFLQSQLNKFPRPAKSLQSVSEK